MKEIRINQIRLVNFKGIRSLECNFGYRTSISGCNGLGKSTIFDAFVWLLFGKNSADNAKFNIKTLDTDGNVIPRIPHEVTAILTVDGLSVTLTRRYKEKWVKTRGTATETFKGNEEEYLYNDVPLSKKEYNERIAAICDEDVFRMITNVSFFNSMAWDKQRSILFDMAGTATDAEIAAGNAEFTALLDRLQGKSLEDFKKEVAAKKKVIKAEVATIPSRIDEVQRNTPSEEEWDTIQDTILDHQSALQPLKMKLADASEEKREFYDHRDKLIEQRESVRAAIRERTEALHSEVTEDYYKKLADKNRLHIKAKDIQRDIDTEQDKIKNADETIAKCTEKRDEMRAEWKRIKAENIVFNEGDFICPTCKRPFDDADIVAKKQELTDAFNQDKQKRLENAREIGKKNAATIETAQGYKDSALSALEALTSQLEEIEREPLFSFAGTKPDAKPIVDADEQLKSLRAQENAISAEIDKPFSGGSDRQQVENEIKRIEGEIIELNKVMGKRDIIDNCKKRVAELEKQLQEQNNALAELEGLEFTMEQFSKAKVDAAEEKINALFRYTRFRLFEQQINGGLVETCKAMVNGVPYADVNRASKINCGLDIINALSSHYGINAPIWIDNAESILQTIETQAQVVKLIVTEDNTLTIKN